MPVTEDVNQVVMGAPTDAPTEDPAVETPYVEIPTPEVEEEPIVEPVVEVDEAPAPEPPVEPAVETERIKDEL